MARLAGSLLGAFLGAIVALLSVIAWATASERAATLGYSERLSEHGILTLTLFGAGIGFVLGFVAFGAVIESITRAARASALVHERQLQQRAETKASPAGTLGS